jgi:hypothetical protein
VIASSLIIAGGYVLGSLLRASANGHGRGESRSLPRR